MIFYESHRKESELKEKTNPFLRFLFLFVILISLNGKDLYSDFIMPISADLDYYDLNIGYEFSGDYLTLFGTKENLERIAIKMNGPTRNYLINKREKALNLWIKRNTQILQNIPSYHASWVSDDIRRDEGLIDFYDIESKNSINQNYNNDFIESFLNDMHDNKKLYYDYEIINNTNNNLFKVNLFLPNNATIGNYVVDVMSFDKKNNIDGKIMMTFNIAHSDFNHFIYRMNKEAPRLYAVFLILFAFLSVGVIKYFY